MKGKSEFKRSEVSSESLDRMIREELDNLEEARPKSSRTKSGKKVPGKYLTKDKAAMKGEIERVSKLKSDDPSAYGKWKADYKARDTKDGKPHKTKKSAATIAYEKKFGKKNEILNKLNEMDTNNEKYQECYDEIDMRLPWDKERLPHYELDEIADTCGLEFEEVLNIFQKYLVDREQKKYQELKKEIKNIFDEIDFYNNNYTFQDFMDYWNDNNFPMDYGWASDEEIKKVFDELTINPNQLKMDLDENTDKALASKAKASGISKSILRAVYSKGAAAWKSGHRPGVSQQQWAMGRVNSFLTGKGGARKADADLWARAKKSKKRKNESLNESSLRKVVRSILMEIHNVEGLGTLADMTGVDVTKILPYSDLVTAIALKWGWDHELTSQIAYALEIKDAAKREKRIIDLLHDYDAYDGFFHYLGLNELYPLMVGEDNLEEGIGKYLAGAAIAASLAGAPLKSSGQSSLGDFSKEKISAVKDRIETAFQKKNSSKSDLTYHTADASLDSLKDKVGKLEKIGDNRYKIVGVGRSDNETFAHKLALANAQKLAAQNVKGVKTSDGSVVTFADVSRTFIEDERTFSDEDGFTTFITVSLSVD